VALQKKPRWSTFISYTTREEEIRVIKPFVDDYIDELKRQVYAVCPVYCEGQDSRSRIYGYAGLEKELRKAIRGSKTTSALHSPGYYDAARGKMVPYRG